MLQVFIFPTFFEEFGLVHPLLAHPSFSIRFENKQKCIGFIDISDALTEAKSGHPRERQKSKNERHAAWERSGAKRKERHAAWELKTLFEYFMARHGAQDGFPQNAPDRENKAPERQNGTN